MKEGQKPCIQKCRKYNNPECLKDIMWAVLIPISSSIKTTADLLNRFHQTSYFTICDAMWSIKTDNSIELLYYIHIEHPHCNQYFGRYRQQPQTHKYRHDPQTCTHCFNVSLSICMAFMRVPYVLFVYTISLYKIMCKCMCVRLAKVIFFSLRKY